MATRDWPTGPQWDPQSVTWGARVPTSGWAGFYSGQRQRVAHLGHRQVVTLTLPAWRDAAQAAAREAWLQSLVASGDLVRLLPWHRPQPLGTARGMPTTAAVAAGASAVTLSGVRAGANLINGHSFETPGTAGCGAGWSPYEFGSTGTITRSRVGTFFETGAWSQRLEATALGTASTDRVGVQQTVTGLASLAGGVATFSAYALGGAGGASVRAYADFYSGGGGLLGSIDSGVIVANPASFARLAATGAVPVNTSYAICYLWMSSRPVAAGPADVYFDAVQLQAGPLSAYTGFATFLAGDFFGAGGQLHQAASDTTCSDVGGAAVTTVLPVRRALALGAPVTLLQPTATFELAAAELAAAYTPGLVQQPLELTFVEAF